jgi:hypothetical protein
MEGCGSDPNWIRIQSGQWIRIRIRNPVQEGKNDPQKKKKLLENSCLEVLDVLYLEQKASFVTWMFFTEALVKVNCSF